MKTWSIMSFNIGQELSTLLLPGMPNSSHRYNPYHPLIHIFTYQNPIIVSTVVVFLSKATMFLYFVMVYLQATPLLLRKHECVVADIDTYAQANSTLHTKALFYCRSCILLQ